MYSMCNKRLIEELFYSCGYHNRWPRFDRYQQITFLVFVSIFILMGCEASNNTAKYKDVHDMKKYDIYFNKKWNEDKKKLFIGRSGDPWSSSSLKYENNEHHRLNGTQKEQGYNDSQVGQTKLSSRHGRFKRGVTHLYNMVVCATGCNPLAYKGYGCYCGFLGSGFVIDGIDRCCKMHDWCYDATECPMFMEYFVPYYWRCYRGYKPICAIEHGNWGGSGSCAQRLCECDRSLAECLKRFPCPRTKAVCTSSPWRLVQNIFMML